MAHRDGKTESVDERRIPAKNQFALERDHRPECIRTGRMPRTPDQEGLADQRINRAAVSPRAVAGLDTNRGLVLPQDQAG